MIIQINEEKKKVSGTDTNPENETPAFIKVVKIPATSGPTCKDGPAGKNPFRSKCSF
ncbi:MAG: hypothetical protein GY804_13850 [Alphaproteobacteria bacterium]|nr:hypothetical protein [Alphaproteobacteria bacterium]